MSLPGRLPLGLSAATAAVVTTIALVAEVGASARSATTPDLPAFHLVAGAPLAPEPWVLPVRGYRLTGRFGDGGGYWSSGAHTGLDFAAPTGTPIRAVADGEVVSSGEDGAYGLTTVITLVDGSEVWFCHQDSQSVVPGQRVRRGEVIGTVGSSGNVTGPHLHLEVRPAGGDPVDPEAALRRHRVEP